MRSVDRYIDVQHPDGTCEEGPSYFGHAGANLIKFLDLLDRATDGHVNIFSNEKSKHRTLHPPGQHPQPVFCEFLGCSRQVFRQSGCCLSIW